MSNEISTNDSDDFEITTENISNNNNSSVSEELLARLKQIKVSLAVPSINGKQKWQQFIPVWCDILRHPLSDVPLCYIESAQVLTNLIELSSFGSVSDDKTLSHESALAALDVLNCSHFKSYLQLSSEEQASVSNKLYFVHTYILLTMVTQASFSATFTSIDDQRRIEQYQDFFTIVINHVDQSMPENSEIAVNDEYSLGDINESILMMLWNAVDQTVIVPTFLKCGLAEKVTNWLSQSTKLVEASRRPLISIIHNISRHDDGADELNKYGAIEKIKLYQKSGLENTDSETLIASMALALLSTPEQLKSNTEGINTVLNQLLQLVMNAAKSEGYRCDGFHVSEPLGVLVKMFVVDERVLDYVLCQAKTEPPSDMHSTIQLFTSLFLDFSQALKGTNRLEQFTLIALLNIFWSISFQPTYTPELMKNETLIEIIKSFMDDSYEQKVLEQYKSRSMEGIKEAAHGIFHNLNIDNQTEHAYNKHRHAVEAVVESPLKPTKRKPMIMISYCHSNNIFCEQIFNFLSKRNDVFDIWIDRTHCQSAGDLWESIAEGMEQSCVIICLVSIQYFESKSCRKEFTYASDTLKKTVVPILLENFQPRGWLGIRIPDMKYVRFRDPQLEQSKLSELLNTILSSISSPALVGNEKPPKPSVVTVIDEPSTLRPFDQWTSKGDDISTWFEHNRISRKIHDLFEFQTGREMLDYAEILMKDTEKQRSIYSKIYSDKYNGSEMPPHEFNRFSIAMEELLKENRPSSFSAIKKSSASKNSSTCIVL